MHEAPRTFGRPEPTFECDLPACARSLGRLRARFAGWLDAIGVGGGARRDLLLTVSEVAHAALPGQEATGDGGKPGSGGHRMQARAWRDDEGVVIEVVDDHRDTLEARTRSRETVETVDGGRGLAILAALADVLTVRDVDGARLVRARIGWEHLAAVAVSG